MRGSPDEIVHDTLQGTALCECRPLFLGAVPAFRDLQHPFEPGLAPEVLGDGTQCFYEASGRLAGGGALAGGEGVEAGAEAPKFVSIRIPSSVARAAHRGEPHP